jgi:hypothetical protein
VLRHAYLMRPVRPARPGRAGARLRLALGTGPTPETAPELPEADALFRVEGVLRKHFAGAGAQAEGWLAPAAAGNPLGFDWMSLHYGDGPAPEAATLVLEAGLVAAP